MNKYLNQVSHNADFLRHQCKDCCDKYFDWKVICCFYVAYHAVMALAEKKNINIGKSHSQISANINPNGRSTPKMPVNRHCWKNYRDLRVDSESARYNGFANIKDHEDQNRENLAIAFTRMNEVIKYCNGRGLDIKPIASTDTIDLITI